MSSPTQSSMNLKSSSLKDQLDASRRPSKGQHVRRAVSSHLTPRKVEEEHRARPRTAEGLRLLSSKSTDTASLRRSGSGSGLSALSTSSRLSPAKCSSPPAAPTPPPSRSNSTASVSTRSSPMKATKTSPDYTSKQPIGCKSSPPKRTSPKLKLRGKSSPPKRTSLSASARSSPRKVSSTGKGSAQKVEFDSTVSPPKRTPPKLRLRRSTPAVDLVRLSESHADERVVKSPSISHVAKSPQAIDLNKLEVEAGSDKNYA